MKFKKMLICFIGFIYVLSSPGGQLGIMEVNENKWSSYPAKDFAEIKIVEDFLDPMREHVLRIKHERTRTSKIISYASVTPYSSYLLALQVRTGKDYVKTGMGLLIKIYSSGKKIGSKRFFGAELSEKWKTVKMPFVSNASNKIRIMIFFHTAAGEVFIDNVKFKKCSRKTLRKILGSGCVDSIPQIPVKNGEADARVWYNEIIVSQKIVSGVGFQFRTELPREVWESSRVLKLELPSEIEIKIPKKIKVILMPNGYRQYSFEKKHITKFYGSKWWCNVLLKQTAPLGKSPKARFWVEWEGGKQKPVEVDILSLNILSYKQPKKVLTGTQSASLMARYYADKYPEIIKSLGFNYMTFWKLGAGGNLLPLFRKNGIMVETEHSGLCEYINKVKNVKEAQAVNTKGKKVNIINPAHRGKIYKNMLEAMDRMAAHGFSGIAIDDEYYNDWRGVDVDMSDSTKILWKKWLITNRPDLKYIAPEVLLDDPLGHREQYDAWWMFKCSLMKDWYGAVRKRFFAGVKKHGIDPKAIPWMTLQAGRVNILRSKIDLYNYRDLLNTFDYFSPQYYCNPIETREKTRDLVKTIGKEHSIPLINMGGDRINRFTWKKGEIKAQILEILFAGAKGYCSWGWHYSNLRIIVEMARTNDAIAKNEDIFVGGKRTNSFEVENEPRQFASVLETDKNGLLLVSNYTKIESKKIVTVRKNNSREYLLTEVFTGEKIRLSKGQSLFYVKVQPDTCSLFRWKK